MKIYTIIKEHKSEFIGLLFLLLISSYLRFSQLGFSNFYGDETKTIYWNKGVSADQFLLNQRKGPIQFLAVWFMEKTTGGYNEFFVRFPFALASTTAVFALYVFLRRRYDISVALFGSLLFSIFGFNIAFGRTAQYQSFLLLFGILALLFADRARESKKTLDLVLSGGFLSLAFLSHYDAIFFAVPVIYLLVKKFRLNFKRLFPFLIAFFVPTLLFYLPYLLGGYFEDGVVGYLSRRLVGSELRRHSSYYTFLTYNPSFVWLVFLAFSIWGFIKASREEKLFYLIWFSVPFVLFEFVFSRPGTHIHNYFLPLLVLAATSVSSSKLLKYIFSVLLAVVLVSNARVYVPELSYGYPWAELPALKEGYHVFIYGFPYNRGWNEVAEYLREEDIESFYTNDNVTIGEWYLRDVPADFNEPHFYISVENNQEFRENFSKEEIDREDYELVKEVFVNGKNTANIYRRFN